jgi:heterodisulfide reductase subunit A-like polyferredoxin
VSGAEMLNFMPTVQGFCMTALKYAHEIKSAIPDCYISDIYIDMHAFGKGHEDFYLKSSEAKTLF